MTLYDFDAKRLDGSPSSLSEFRGRVVLVVNVASRCGYTPQYAGLEALYRRHRDKGFVVLGFPCNQFGAQEPGTADEIAGFCSRTFGVTFPMFAKVDVNGAKEHPLFTFLKQEKPGALGTKSIKWNFTKFLIAADGAVLKRYGPATTPEEIDRDVTAALASRPA
jgi:glutathione peroxidase